VGNLGLSTAVRGVAEHVDIDEQFGS